METIAVELEIGGMTCAACAARIEKRLNKLEGVEASVNYATEQARIAAPPGVSVSQLIDQVEAAGYTARPAAAWPGHTPESGTDVDRDAAGDETAPLRNRLVLAAALSVPVIVLAMVPALQFDAWQWLCLTLSAPVVVWGAWPFHRAAWLNLRHGAATMDTLISLGVSAAFGWSLYALFFGHAGVIGTTHGFSFTPRRGEGASQIYLEVATGVTVFLLTGRYLEVRAKRSAGAALRALLELGAHTVTVTRNGEESVVPIEQLAVGDRFVVRPGEKIATDGIVEEGASAVDASLLTGESVPVDVGPGDTVTGATINAGGRLVVRATHIGADTALAHIARMVQDAQSGKAPIQRLADRVAMVFVPVVLVLAAATVGFWLTAATTDAATTAFTAGVAVLIIACPCALGLATPTALLVGTGRGAQLGILIKGPEILESTRRVDTIVLDKTGTVTSGAMTMVDVVTGSDTGTDTGTDADIDTALRLAGSLEAASEHPIGRAIAAGAKTRGLALSPVTEFASTGGLGVQGVVEGHSVMAGREQFLAERSLHLPESLRHAKDQAEHNGATAVVVGWDGAARAVIVVSDTVKDSSAAAISRLRNLGLSPLLLTGDNQRSARAVAAQVGMANHEVIAEVLPQDKVAVIERLQGEGRVVAMVGDGVNDAAALARADLGLAMGNGTDVAIEASDITLTRNDLGSVVDAIRLSRKTLRIIKGNLFWAFAYNVAALPIAAAGLLNPMLAGFAMAFSSVFVVTNSLRLRRFQGQGGRR
ncbi:MAG: heavy metal translocating P-type ATPase [Acidimicrobiales bacterium]